MSPSACRFQALDEKTVLLRSEYALSRATLRLFQLLGAGYDQHRYIHTDAGLEQEFFLIDREYYLKRPDLSATGEQARDRRGWEKMAGCC